jgi:hypothetical protein
MAKQIDLTNLGHLVEQGQQAESLKRQLQGQLEKVQKAQEQLSDQLDALSSLLQEGKKAGGRGRPKGKAVKGAKESHPKPNSAPEQLCKVMSSSKPMQVEEIAKKTNLSTGTVKQYIHKFDCFYSAGRGKGYLYKPSSSAGQATRATGMEMGQKKTKGGKKKATKKTKKKTAGK